MIPNNTASNILVEQQIRRFQNDLMSWTNQVRGARHFRDALRIAANKPTPGSLVRSLSGMVSVHRKRAEQDIERVLLERVKDIDGSDKDLLNYMRMSQGHWPEVWRILDQKRRAR